MNNEEKKKDQVLDEDTSSKDKVSTTGSVESDDPSMPPLPKAIPDEERKRIMDRLTEKYKDGEDIDDDEDEMSLYLPR